MTAEERERIRTAAITNGRRERRAQGIPERVESPVMTARLAVLLRGGGDERSDA